jgi:hypothetical protein
MSLETRASTPRPGASSVAAASSCAQFCAFLSANQCTVVHDRACIYASTWRRGPCVAHLRCGRSTQLRIASINDLPTKRGSASITGCWVAVPLARGCGACRPGPTYSQNSRSAVPAAGRRRRCRVRRCCAGHDGGVASESRCGYRPSNERREQSRPQAADGYPDFGMTFGNPDFVSYAQAYGIAGSRVERAESLVPTLEAAFVRGGVYATSSS